MTTRNGIGRGRRFSTRSRSGSTSVESSSRASLDMQCAAASALGTSLWRNEGANPTAKQYDSDEFSRGTSHVDRRKTREEGEASVRPDLEAYCDGSWWDVKILKKDPEEAKYYVHYHKFDTYNDQWLPLVHLRMRCRTLSLSDCNVFKHGMDVCVMTKHPHSDQKNNAWYDAKIHDIKHKPHVRGCKCRFQVCLYTIPNTLPLDISLRKLLPVSSTIVTLRNMSFMREARNMSFVKVVDAALPSATDPPARLWAKDGACWHSSLDPISSLRERSLSLESRVAGESVGLSRSEDHNEERTTPILASFDSFLEEEGFVSPVCDVRDEDAEFPVVSGSKAQPIVLDVDDVAICENDQSPGYDDIFFLDKFSSDESEERGTSPDRGNDIRDHLDLSSSGESLGNHDEDLDEVVASDVHSLRADEGPEEVVVSDDHSLRPDEDLEEVVLSDLHSSKSDEDLEEVVVADLPSLKPAEQSPMKPSHVMPKFSFSLPSVQTTVPVKPIELATSPSLPVPVKPVELATSPSLPVPVKPIELATSPSLPVPVKPIELATSTDDSRTKFEKYLQQAIEPPMPTATDEPARSSDEDGYSSFIEGFLAEDPGPGRSYNRNHGSRRRFTQSNSISRSTAENLGAKRSFAKNCSADRSIDASAKRRRVNPQRNGARHRKNSIETFFNELLPKKKPSPHHESHSTAQLSAKRPARERSTVYPFKNLTTVTATLATTPVKGSKTSDAAATLRDEDFADDLENMLMDESTPNMSLREILANSKEAFKLPPQVVKEKKLKEIPAVPKFEEEITYASLFKKMEQKQEASKDIPSKDKMPPKVSSLLPEWNPELEELGLPLPQEVNADPYADAWEMMRDKGANDKMEEIVEEPAVQVGVCRHSDGSMHPEHGDLEFDQEFGETCVDCRMVVNDIRDMWARERCKKIGATKNGIPDMDGNSYMDVDTGGFDEDLLASFYSDDENHEQRNNPDVDSNFDLIPDLAKAMKPHQKQGFRFLWRNLDGQRSNGKTPSLRGGCVLSHAPGTGKTFLVISFLQSYIKKYPGTRTIILAPKIMLQPWEKEFRRWNVNIPVYNFNEAGEQGRPLVEKHKADGIQRRGSRAPKLPDFREAMVYEWTQTPSVLLISYQMFNNLYKKIPSSTLQEKRYKLGKVLLDCPTIMVLDEGHIVRNKQAQVLKQMHAVKTPLRVMLSGTLFQNNFEELYTCLDAVRQGFVRTFAKLAGLKLNIPQELEHQDGVMDEERKEKAIKLVDAVARKFFIEEIGNKIDKGQKTSSDTLDQGLEQLRRLTSPFIHHYTGAVLQGLPPLRDFTIMFQPTALQEKMINKLQEKLGDKTMLERECLLSLVCIHPNLLLQHNVGRNLTDLLPQKEMDQLKNRDPAVGAKTRFVINLLTYLKSGQEKILIFCQNLYPLQLIEDMLKLKFGWIRERDILQIDGKVQATERQSIIERFNDPKGNIRVLLASTKACGEGVTLTGASRVIFLDVLWNPAVIRQAIHRAFRIGQTKVVHVYRLVFSGTFEEEKYRRMVWKDHKSQAIFYESQEEAEKNSQGNSKPGFWEIKNQLSKDDALNDLWGKDAKLEQQFKHIFRHGGLFDDNYDKDPEGKGIDATDWLRNIENIENSTDLETDDGSGEDVSDTEEFDGLDED